MDTDFLARSFRVTKFEGDTRVLEDGRCLLRCCTDSGVVVFWGDMTEEYGLDNINEMKKLETNLPIHIGCQCKIPGEQSKRKYLYSYSVPYDAEIEILDDDGIEILEPELIHD